jgi:DNA-binding SARP family transcriptional activator/tetratricopeptide (TPR) repeat protein
VWVHDAPTGRVAAEDVGHPVPHVDGAALPIGDALADLEEAADRFIAAGELPEAVEAVQRAAPVVMRRGDWDKLLAWCSALGEPLVSRHSELRELQVRALLMSRRQEDVEPLLSRMRRSGEFSRLVDAAPDVAARAVWAVHGSGDLHPLLEIAPAATASTRARVVRYVLEVCSGRKPPPEWDDADLDRPQPLHVALQAAVYYRGRLAEAERLAWAAAERGPVTATLAQIYRIEVLRVRGDLSEARHAFEATGARIRETRYIEFWQQLDAELAFDEGDQQRGLRLIREARATSRRHGYRLADRAVFAAIEGKMLARMGRAPEAVELLELTRAWCTDRGLGCFREWAQTWLGAALLDLGGADQRALGLLSDAVGGMRMADRRLELIAALVSLAEARWRAGDEAGHDTAADEAYVEALRMGTLTPLLAALSHRPSVLARMMDAAVPDDDRWHRLDRTLSAGKGDDLPTRARITVNTMGRAVVTDAGGRDMRVTPPRAVELAAILARAGSSGVAREALIESLLGERAAGANYLRQLVHRLRRALPEGIEITSRSGRLAWAPAHAVVSEDQLLEAAVLRARRETGAARASSIELALELAARGDCLPDSDSASARRRRDELAVLIAEARREHVLSLLSEGHTQRASELARAAVEADPYREDRWQLLMRAAAAAEGPSAVLPVFRECAERLAQLGAEPSQETRRLVERLRE